MSCGSGGSKSRLAKAAGAEPCGQMRDESCTPLWREAHSQVKKVKIWKLRCWKSARHCGAKHMSKSKCTKHTILRPLLEVEMLKKCTPLWSEAHFEVMYKTHHVRTAFGSWDVEKVHTVVGRSTFRSQQFKKLAVSEHFWKLRCQNRCGAKHLSKSKVEKTEGFGALLDVQMLFRVAGTRDWAPCQKWARREGSVAASATTTTTLHYTALPLQLQLQLQLQQLLHYTTLHYTNYITLHCTQPHSITLH